MDTTRLPEREHDIAASLAWLALITVAGAALRLYALDRDSLWLDEAASVARASTDWTTLFRVFAAGEPNMILYFGLLHFWLALGRNEFLIRLLSVIFSVATIPLLYALARRLFDTRVALLAALLLCINAIHFQYAQEARAYALVVFLATASWLFFVRSLDENHSRDWLGWIAATTLAVYAHLFGGLVFAAELATLVFLDRERIPARRLARSALAIAILLVPIALVAAFSDRNQLNWLLAGPKSVLMTLNALAGAGNSPDYTITPALRVLMLAIAGFAIFDFIRRANRLPELTRSYAVVLAGAFVPLGIAIVISLFTPVLAPRFLLISQPSFVLLVAVGLRRIPGMMLMRGTVALVIGLALIHDWQYYRPIRKENWRAATEYLLRHQRSDDALIIYHPQGWSPFHYYSERLGGVSKRPDIVFPAWKSPLEHQLNVVEMSKHDGPSTELLATLPARYQRVWLVLSHDTQRNLGRPQTRDAIKRMLLRDYKLNDARKFHKVNIELYELGSQTPSPRDPSSSAAD